MSKAMVSAVDSSSVNCLPPLFFSSLNRDVEGFPYFAFELMVYFSRNRPCLHNQIFTGVTRIILIKGVELLTY